MSGPCDRPDCDRRAFVHLWDGQLIQVCLEHAVEWGAELKRKAKK